MACGINDLSRYNHTADSLYNIIGPKLRQFCDQNKSTTFIFSSLLFTRHEWLNKEVMRFNKYMLELSCELENLLFLDTCSSLNGTVLAHHIDNILPRNDKGGIHLSHRAMDHCGTVLVNAVLILTLRWARTSPPARLQGWIWPLSDTWLGGLSKLRSSLGPRWVYHYEYVRRPLSPPRRRF